MAIPVALVGGLLLGSASEAAALEQKLVASDGASSDGLGDSAAIDGNTIVAGAPFDDSFRGAVYVFTRSGDVWLQAAKLTASDRAADDRFGESVAIDGDTIVIGAPYDDAGANRDQGSVYVFARAGSAWTQAAKLTIAGGAAGDWLGNSIAVDGDTIVAGAPRDEPGAFGDHGAAYVFARSGDTWAQAARLTASDALPGDLLGYSVALDGDTIVAGALFDDAGTTSAVGSAYTFARTGGDRMQTAKLTASDGAGSDWFGESVAIDGDTIVVGAEGDDSHRGSVYTFARTGGNRTQTAKLTAAGGAAQHSLGASVAIGGDKVVAGAPGFGPNQFQGAAYTFARTGGNRTQTARLTASDGRASDQLGRSVATDGSTIAAGSPGDTVGANAGQGSVSVFFEAAPPPDSTAPATDIRLDPAAPTGDNGWYRTPPTVTVSASDAGGSGVAETRCVLDPPAAPATFDDLPAGCPYVGAGADVSGDGMHRIYAASSDAAGNEAAPVSVTFGIDATAPEVACGAADGQWHADNVAIGCSASDSTSGLADPADAALSLTTSVPAGEETADAATGSRQVCDSAGNCATAGPIGGNMVDRKAPDIAIGSPPNGARYSVVLTLLAPVRASYKCTDAGSGVASCEGPVPNGGRIGTSPADLGQHTFTVTAIDRVGNTSSRTHRYSVVVLF